MCLPRQGNWTLPRGTLPEGLSGMLFLHLKRHGMRESLSAGGEEAWANSDVAANNPSSNVLYSPHILLIRSSTKQSGTSESDEQDNYPNYFCPLQSFQAVEANKLEVWERSHPIGVADLDDGRAFQIHLTFRRLPKTSQHPPQHGRWESTLATVPR